MVCILYMSYVLHAYFLTLKIHNNVFSPLILSRCQDVILSSAIKTVIRSVVTCIMHLTVVCILVWIKLFFQDSEETIHSAETNATSYESHGDFHWEKTKQKFLNNPITKNKKTKQNFPALPILNFFHQNFIDWSLVE